MGSRKKINLIIAAHPDDELIGMGGTIAKKIDNKEEVYVLYVADGESSRNFSNKKIQNKIKMRKNQAIKCSKLLRFKIVDFLNLADNSLDQYPLLTIVKKIGYYIKLLKPNFVFTHYPQDLNIDHRIVSDATIVATRAYDNKFIQEICFFEICSSTDYYREKFHPNKYVDITRQIFKKKVSAKAYNSQFKKENHPLSINALINLARYRGNFINTKYAEAFIINFSKN